MEYGVGSCNQTFRGVWRACLPARCAVFIHRNQQSHVVDNRCEKDSVVQFNLMDAVLKSASQYLRFQHSPRRMPMNRKPSSGERSKVVIDVPAELDTFLKRHREIPWTRVAEQAL